MIFKTEYDTLNVEAFFIFVDYEIRIPRLMTIEGTLKMKRIKRSFHEAAGNSSIKKKILCELRRRF